MKDVFRIYEFNHFEGLLKPISPYAAVCHTRDNVLQWGAKNGVITLDLNSFEIPETPPRIKLNNLKIEGKPVDYRRIHDKEYSMTLPFAATLQDKIAEDESIDLFENYPSSIKLPYALNHVGFEFSAIDWNAPHAIRYSHKLDGFNETWSTPSSETNAQFMNLLPGKYTFQVKAIGMAQIWSEPFSYQFRVKPPWWLTWWAISIYVIGLTSLILAVYRIQLRRKLAVGEAQEPSGNVST